jgi:Protein of unknown function (DUF4019)
MRSGKCIANLFVTVCFVQVLCGACALKAGRNGIPPEVDSVIATFSDDLAEGRYEKIYTEAADEWRRDATLEQSNKVFETLKGKLGKPGNRTLQSASEQNSSNGQLAGHSFVLLYETKFERAESMETFTLVERNGHWLLARYFVNSTALK